eukprot:Amastigsp_a339836_34.p2 type:complete len:177 gc:universal Amastigsp_a339836_34:759-229(-)
MLRLWLQALAFAFLAVVSMAQSAPKCVGATSCSSCVKLSGCGWCTTPRASLVPGANGTSTASYSPMGCVSGSFLKAAGCGRADWKSSQCAVPNLYILLSGIGAGLLVLCIFCTWLYCVCRARNKRKTKRLLDDHDAWVANLHASTENAGTPKTNARRAEMAAKYGTRGAADDVPLL